MSESSRANHARYGRVFETSMLCFEIKKCDCCGISIPFHDDPQQQKCANSKDHSFRRHHLVMKFHTAWFCDCDAVCRGGQYYRAPRCAVRSGVSSAVFCGEGATAERKAPFLLFDPASTSDAEQVQAMFEESISDLFEPGMHEWRQVTIPTDESHHDQYRLAATSLTMWLTVWQQNNTVFRDNSVELKFFPNASSTSLAAWARKWMHRSLVAGAGAQVTRRRANYGSA
jgi:hypothetical protein